jgi:hypothetical protein
MACTCGDTTTININVPGLDTLLAGIVELKELLMNETEQVTALSAKVDDLVADVRAALEILRAERDNFGTEGQAAFDALSAKVDAFDAEIGDADGSDVPPPVEE